MWRMVTMTHLREVDEGLIEFAFVTRLVYKASRGKGGTAFPVRIVSCGRFIGACGNADVLAHQSPVRKLLATGGTSSVMMRRIAILISLCGRRLRRHALMFWIPPELYEYQIRFAGAYRRE